MATTTKPEVFELPTNRRKRRPRNEAGARRVRMGARTTPKAAQKEEDEGVDGDKSARCGRGQALPTGSFVLGDSSGTMAVKRKAGETDKVGEYSAG